MLLRCLVKLPPTWLATTAGALALLLLAYLIVARTLFEQTADGHGGVQLFETPFATSLSASLLLSRPLPRNYTTVPRILHQSWKSGRLPSKFAKWSHSCRQLHPGWAWVLWTDEDNLRLVRTYYPWLEAAYRALPAEIYRADLARSLYMYTFGGSVSSAAGVQVYLDLDTECLRPADSLIDEYSAPRRRPLQTALLGRMGDNPGFKHSIPNAWMASPPAHPFFLVLLRNVRWRMVKNDTQGVPPEELTGPVALRDSLVDYETAKVKRGTTLGAAPEETWLSVPHSPSRALDHQVALLPSEAIYPYSWGDDGEAYRNMCWVLRRDFDAVRCKQTLKVVEKGSTCITYWSHSHSPDGTNEENMKSIE